MIEAAGAGADTYLIGWPRSSRPRWLPREPPCLAVLRHAMKLSVSTAAVTVGSCSIVG
jgi:hypothetical protein